MAFRYLIYSTGTTYISTIVRESAINNPTIYEASYYTDFVIPEIQPLYLWRVNNAVTPTGVIPNTDANIYAYEDAIAPPPTPNDYITYGQVTGMTAGKIDTVTGATGNVPIFTADGNVEDSGLSIPEITGLTTYTFIGSGGTQVFTNGNQITIKSTVPTGTTVQWGDITGTLSNQTDLWGVLSGMTGETANKLDIAVFTGFTADTAQEFQNVYGEIDWISGQTLTKSQFNNYTGTTQPILNAALTGLTNLGTGSTLGGTSGRNVTIKSISAVGGVTLLGDGQNLIISGQTNVATTWGNITGTLSNQTDLWGVLTGITGDTASKLDIAVFTGYTATTDQRLQGIEGDIQYISGITDTKLDESVFANYTGTTAPILAAALTGATNGITASGRNVELGGTLTKDTSIIGTAYGLTANTKNILLQAVNGINIIDTDGTGGINIESDAGTISLIGNSNLGVEKTKLQISETQMLITDSRATQVGLQYAADYSTTFTNESLITKRYADAIAAGLVPKAAVKVATIGAITLSGLSTIDGVALSNGDRVLVKNQASAATNGIYVASASTWTRATDYDGTPTGEVTSGNIIPVISGNTNSNTLWVLVTPNPIAIDVTPLSFTLFASPHYVAGHGIGITGNTIFVDGSVLDGNSILWSGGTFNVDVNSGGLSVALGEKLDVTTFTGYTASTQSILNGTLTGATNGLHVSGRNVVLGGNLTGNTTINGLKLHDLFIANINEFQVATDGLTGATFGVDTTGIMLDFSGTSVELNSNAGLQYGADYSTNYTIRSLVDKGYVTGLTSALQADIDYVSGVTDTKLDISVFTGYTATTKNKDKKMQIVWTGTSTALDLNTVAATAIPWNTTPSPYATDIYSWTGGSKIKILSAGTYEVLYHVTLKNSAANQTKSIGGYLIKTSGVVTTTIPLTATAAMVVGPNSSGELSLPPVVLSLAANDFLELAGFRIGNAGNTYAVSGSVYLVLNKLT